MFIKEITMDDVVISKAVKAVNVLTIPQLITFLKIMSEQYAWSANDLRKSWTNPNTDTREVDELGKIWGIASQGIGKAANDIQKYQETLQGDGL